MIAKQMKFGRALLACWLLHFAQPVFAACPAEPAGFVLPPPIRLQVDLIHELDHPWQAGGAIVLTCAPDGSPRAGRSSTPPRNASEEQARRAEHFALAKLDQHGTQG
jgi:hypothetical protein